MSHLILRQTTNSTEQVDSSCINDLYLLTTSLALDATSDLQGRINTAVSTAAKINKLHTLDENSNPVQTGNLGAWDNLYATATTYAIDFEDETVKTIIQNYLIKKGYDSDLTSTNLSKITSLDKNVGFNLNSEITTLNDIQYLTACTSIAAGTFDNIPNVTSIIFPSNLVYLGTIVLLRKLEAIRIPNKVTGTVIIKGCDKLELAVIDASLDAIQFDEQSWNFSCPNDVVIRGSADSIILYNNKSKTPTVVANIWVPDVSVYSAKSGFADYVGRLKPISDMPVELANRVNNLQ